MNIEKDGFVKDFEDAGATVLAKACGLASASGSARCPLGVKNTIVTSYNRNFAKRDHGNPDTHALVTSPEPVTMLAFSGRLDFNPTSTPFPPPTVVSSA